MTPDVRIKPTETGGRVHEHDRGPRGSQFVLFWVTTDSLWPVPIGCETAGEAAFERSKITM